MRLRPHEIAIGILGNQFESGIYPDPYFMFEGQEGDLQFLRDLTEEDFGDDIVRWKSWFAQCPDDLVKLLYEAWERARIMKDRAGRLINAEGRWTQVTTRRCPNCDGLCPEYRNQCWVCEHAVGRISE